MPLRMLSTEIQIWVLPMQVLISFATTWRALQADALPNWQCYLMLQDSTWQVNASAWSRCSEAMQGTLLLELISLTDRAHQLGCTVGIVLLHVELAQTPPYHTVFCSNINWGLQVSFTIVLRASLAGTIAEVSLAPSTQTLPILGCSS